MTGRVKKDYYETGVKKYREFQYPKEMRNWKLAAYKNGQIFPVFFYLVTLIKIKSKKRSFQNF